MSELDKQREAFERWITKPPFEHTCTRKGADSAWPGSYHDIETELAWEAWKEKHYQAAERIAELEKALTLMIVHGKADLLNEHDFDFAEEALAKIDKEPNNES